MRLACALPLLFLVTGSCSVERTAEDSALVVAIQETDREMTIIATSPDGAEFGRVVVTTGPFTMEDDGRVVDGRQMEVTAAGRTARHESEGYKPLQLPLFPSATRPEENQLLVEPRVSAALARWGIGFESLAIEDIDGTAPIALPEEDPYHTCTYGTSATCGAISCIQNPMRYNNGTFCAPAAYQHICCGTSKKVTGRKCGYGAFNSCGTEGTNGCAVCWLHDWTTSCTTGHMTPQQFSCTAGSTVYFNWDITYSYN